MGECSGQDATVQASCDWSERKPSIAVVEAIATIENTKPEELSLFLSQHVDPEALDALVTEGSEVSVSFSVGEYQVEIDEDQLVVSFT